MKLIFLICVLFLIIKTSTPSILCGYNSTAGEMIERQLTRCFEDNISESRAKMAIGFEYCFGDNYQILNDTVEIPYRKKINETTSQILHLSESMCSDNDDALDQFVFSETESQSQNSDGINDAKDKSPSALRKCVLFFSKIQVFIKNQNFDVQYVLKQNVELITPMYPTSSDREKIFKIIVNIIQPLIGCYGPMEKLKAAFIRKFLKQYLVGLVNPTKQSFTNDTYAIMLNPEEYTSQQFDSIKLFGDKTTLFDNSKGTKAIKTQRSVILQQKPDSKLTGQERKVLAKYHEENENKPLEQRDNELMKTALSGKLSDAEFLSLTPAQKLKAGIISQKEYHEKVYLEENHGHMTKPVEIDDFWSDGLSLKKKNFSNEDFDRYKVKGFNIDRKIRELFKI